LLLGGKAVFAYVEGRIESEGFVNSSARQHCAAVRTMNKALRFKANKIAPDTRRRSC
jgi:hypothetical protein